MGRFLIVNADDFGLSEGVNRGIIEAFQSGILTSASLMVRRPDAAAAAAWARNSSRLSVGLHLDLGEWVHRQGEWVPLYTVVDTEDSEAVAKEISRQLSDFQQLMGRNPSHLDSHQHVHRQEPVLSIARDHAARLGVPLRDFSPSIRYCGDFYGQTGEGEHWPEGISLSNLKSILAALPQGTTELGCHAGYGEGLETVYRVERAMETQVLCEPTLRSFLKDLDVQLCSFEGLPPAPGD